MECEGTHILLSWPALNPFPVTSRGESSLKERVRQPSPPVCSASATAHTMPSLANTTLGSLLPSSLMDTTANDLFGELNDGIRRFGADPLTALKSFNIKTIGFVGAGILLAVLLIDILGYVFAAFRGTRRSFVPYSRTIAEMAADAWENRQDNFIGEYYNPYARARSLEPLTGVLDSLAEAVKKWGDVTETEEALTEAHDRSFVFQRQ